MDKIAELERKKSQLEAQLQAARARQSVQARKDDTRRKIIVGAWFLKENNFDIEEIGRLMAAAGDLKERDKRLFLKDND